MVIVVNGGSVRLDEPEDLKGFKVFVEAGDETAVANALEQVGRLEDSETAWIRAESVRSLADGRVAHGWSDGFDAMLDYAASKGWLTDDRREIQAHVQWAEA